MSLINDALKRVKAAQQQAPPSASVGPQFRPVDAPSPVHRTAGWLMPALFASVALVGLVFWWWLRQQSDPAGEIAVRPQAAAADSGAGIHHSIPPTAVPAPANALDSHRTAEGTGSDVSKASSSRAPNSRINQVEGKGAYPQAEQSTASKLPGNPNQPAGVSGAPATENNRQLPISAGPSALTNESVVSNAAVVAAAAPAAPKLPPLKLQAIVFNPKRPSAMINGRTVFIGDKVRDMRVVAITTDATTLAGSGHTNVLTLAE